MKLCLLTLACLLTVSLSACRKRPPVVVPPADAPRAVSAPAANPAATPQRNADEILGAMNEALRNYLAEKGKLPASLEDLYVAHASKQLQPPPGKSFVLNPKAMSIEYR